MNIVVHRCTVRVVRHGGWSWGPQPRALVDHVVDRLPELIAEHFAGVTGDVVEPVCLTVPIRLNDLLSAGPVRQMGVRERAGAVVPVRSPVPAPPPVPSASRADPQETPFRCPPAEDGSLLGFLARLWERDELDGLLALLPARVLRDWYVAVIAPDWGTGTGLGASAEPDLPQRIAEPPEGVIRALSFAADRNLLPALLAAVPREQVQQWHRALSGTGMGGSQSAAELQTAAGRGQDLPERLTALAELAAGIGVLETRQLLRAVLDARDRDASTSPPATITATRSEAPHRGGACSPLAATAQPNGFRRFAPSRAIDVEVPSALAFVLLGPLHRTGYLDAIGPALDAVGLASSSALFATALAQALPGATGASLAAFAGLAESPDSGTVKVFADRVSEVVPVLDAVLARSLTAGHTSGIPLLLTEAAGEPLLADMEGLFPVARHDDISALTVLWRACGRPPLLVSSAVARLDLLRSLDAAGIRFVLDVPPTRAERWRRLPGGLWTNDSTGPPGPLVCAAEGLSWAPERLSALFAALGGHRPPPLRASARLAVTVALGVIAWTLWRDRETPHPLLALERFGGLSARVRMDSQAVRVQLPLGRRHSDLAAHGLLADIPPVPWMDGRVVEFSGG